MRWPWSRSGGRPSPSYVPPPVLPMDDRPVPWYVLPGPAPATRFTGVTREEGQSYGGLYKVRTTDGVWVRLHDMSFMDMTFEPASPPSLRLRFVYDDP